MAKKKRYIPSVKHFREQRESYKNHSINRVLETQLYRSTIKISDDVTVYTIPEDIEEEMREIQHTFAEYPERHIQRLERLLAAHPEYPLLWDHLSTAYMEQGNQEKGIFYIEECYRHHPNYLFARVAYANLCMIRKEIEKIPDIFGGCIDLAQLYPDREFFHITEVVAFCHCMGCYLCETDNLPAAFIYYEGLQKIAPDSPHAVQLGVKLAPYIGMDGA